MAASTRTAPAASARSPGATGRLQGIRLARRAARGDRGAQERIFRRHHQELYRYCLAIVRDPHDAEDALQATMVSAFQALAGEERDIDIRPWLFRIAHNESVSLLRRRSAGEIAAVDLPEATDSSAEDQLETRDRLRRLVGDLGELPERQCSALVMRELSGLSYPEIGEALTCSEGGARQAVFEARTALREREEGRVMECEEVRRTISERDGRRLRGRKLRAHLSGCDGCRAFAAAIPDRRAQLQSLCPPLSAAAAGTMLTGLLGGAGGGAVTGVGAAGVAGGGIAASAAIKGGSIAAAIALAVGAADVGGLIHLPNPVGGADGQSVVENPSAGGGGSGLGAAEAPAADSQVGGNRTLEGRTTGDTHSRGSRADGAGDGNRGGSSSANPAGTSGNQANPGQQPAGDPAEPAGSGNSGSAPGQTGTAPGGGSADAPGQTGVMPGNASTAPGHSGASTGNSAAAPGQTDAPPPGQTDNPGSANGNGASAGPKAK